MIIRACLVYAHTSMFPRQLFDATPASRIQIRTCVTEIIQAAHAIVSQEQLDPRFIVFPLFLAGVETTDPAEKDLALTIIRAVEQRSYGGCTQSVRSLLEMVYGKQHAAVLRMGDSTSVDWIEEKELRGHPPIIYGI